MDPISAVSLAATIVQLVDFSSKLVSKGHHIYHSAKGAVEENIDLEAVTTDLLEISTRLKTHERLGCLSKDDQLLEDLAGKCATISDELLSRLERLKVQEHAKQRKWKSFRQALKTVWSKKDLDALSVRLRGYREEMELRILATLKENNDLVAIQHSDRFDHLDTSTKDLVQMLIENRTAFTRNLTSHTCTISRLHQNTKDHITTEHEKTRSSLLQAIHTSGVEPERARDPQIGLSEDDVLDGLRFATLYARYQAISEAHIKTFDWVFHETIGGDQRWNSFSHWLRKENGFYWVNGKAGSGKSTLMRYIYDDPRTIAMLKEWATEAPIVTGHFFWISGNVDQSSQGGLLQSLLYDILSQRRDLIPIVWSEKEKHSCRKGTIWPIRILKQAFRSLVKSCGNMCMFIDGLDEHSGDPMETLEFFEEITTLNPNIKVCLSSRPWVVFEEAFKNVPKLKLQDLTYSDIQHYVDEKLMNDLRMRDLYRREPIQAPTLAHEIVTKADGVFLWVMLVVRSLLNGLTNKDEIRDLQERLSRIPPEINDLYNYMLAQIEPVYWEESSRLFHLADIGERISFSSMSALVISFAEVKPSMAINRPIKPMTEEERTARIERVDARLRICCAGLLEIYNPGPMLTEKAVRYIHRTAVDFIQNTRSELVRKILNITKNCYFDAIRSGLRAYLLLLKTYSPVRPRLELNYMIRDFMRVARRIESRFGSVDIEVLDELNRTVQYQFNKYLVGNTDGYESSDIIGQTQAWDEDFFACAIHTRLHSFVEAKLISGEAITKGKPGRPYIEIIWKFLVVNNPNIIVDLQDCKRILVLLFEHGADPNERFEERTVWSCLLDYTINRPEPSPCSLIARSERDEALLVILELFLQYRADMSVISENNYAVVGYHNPNFAADVIRAFVEEVSIDASRLLRYLPTQKRKPAPAKRYYHSRKRRRVR